MMTLRLPLLSAVALLTALSACPSKPTPPPTSPSASAPASPDEAVPDEPTPAPGEVPGEPQGGEGSEAVDGAPSLQQAPDALIAGEAIAVAYSGYRAGQHPDRGAGEEAPTRAEVLEDLRILARHDTFRLIRLYDSGRLSETVLEIIDAEELPIKVMLGAWLKAEVSSHETCAWLDEPIPEETLAANREANSREVDRAIALANRFDDVIVAVNVGNEALVTWNDHLVTLDAMLSYARRVKAAVKQPVTTADNYMVFREHGSALAEVLDFFAVHTYPVWEGKGIDEGLAFTIENLQGVRDAVPGARLAIGEAGWPSTASEFGERASEAHQRRYYEELTAWARAMNITTFVFEAFDEDWKGDPNDPQGAEKHWGLFFIDRTPKAVMAERYPELARPATAPHAAAPREGSVVTLEQDGDAWTLRFNGEPYAVRGVGGLWNLELASQLGANSIRTWGAEAWPEAFAQADKLGMTVLAGIWLSHDPADYANEAYLEATRREVDALAREYADHPRLLAWSLGNEVHLEANTPEVWRFIEELAQIIRRHDADHPISTATAHSPPEVLDLIAEHAPSIDLLSVNSYAGLPAVTRDIGRSRFRGPFMITEWGPNGHWETGNTAWGRPIEQPGAEKVAMYRERAKYIASLPACVGSYVFLWGQKQERTPTWYSMFVEVIPDLGLNGEATGAVDVMIEHWTGEPPTNRAPLVTDLTLDGARSADDVTLAPGARATAVAVGDDPDGDDLTWVWELLTEPAELSKHGAPEPRPPRAGVELMTDGATASFVVPQPGEYRIFVYALDGKGKVGTANVAFRVDRKAPPVP